MFKGCTIHSPRDMLARWSCILHYSDLRLVQQAAKYSTYQFDAQRELTTNKLPKFKKFTQNKLHTVKTLMHLLKK
jgi:hypothetical protein